MPTIQYKNDGSCIVTADDGATTHIVSAPQAVQDSAIQTFIANHQIAIQKADLDPVLVAIATLLIQKAVFTKAELRNAVASLNINVP